MASLARPSRGHGKCRFYYAVGESRNNICTCLGLVTPSQSHSLLALSGLYCNQNSSGRHGAQNTDQHYSCDPPQNIRFRPRSARPCMKTPPPRHRPSDDPTPQPPRNEITRSRASIFWLCRLHASHWWWCCCCWCCQLISWLPASGHKVAASRCRRCVGACEFARRRLWPVGVEPNSRHCCAHPPQFDDYYIICAV